MQPYRFLTTMLILMLIAAVGRANPVPDGVAREYQSLPRTIVAGATDAENARCVELYGRYGISRGLLAAADIAYIGLHFAALRDMLAASQGPPYRPNDDLQDCYRVWAGPGDLEPMHVALRRWLTEPVAEAPPEGGMTIESEPHRSRQILDARVRAAELLAHDGDRQSIPLLRALLADSSATSTDAVEWRGMFRPARRLELALGRLLGERPTALVERAHDGTGRIVPILPTLSRAEVVRRSEASECPQDVFMAVCVNLPGCEATYVRSPLQPFRPVVRLEFANGTSLALTRPHDGWLGLVELGSDSRGHWRLTADNLDDVFASLEEPR